MWPILVAWHFDHVHAQRLRPAARAVDPGPTAASVTAVGRLPRAAGHGIVMARRRNSAGARRCCSASLPSRLGQLGPGRLGRLEGPGQMDGTGRRLDGPDQMDGTGRLEGPGRSNGPGSGGSRGRGRPVGSGVPGLPGLSGLPGLLELSGLPGPGLPGPPGLRGLPDPPVLLGHSGLPGPSGRRLPGAVLGPDPSGGRSSRDPARSPVSDLARSPSPPCRTSRPERTAATAAWRKGPGGNGPAWRCGSACPCGCRPGVVWSGGACSP